MDFVGKMKIGVIGAGYVGLVSAACFAEFGFEVCVLDKNENRIENLSKGIIPIYEPGLDVSILKSREAGNLRFTTDMYDCFTDADVIIIAVGTPQKQGADDADLSDVISVVENICLGLTRNKHVCILTKSTVPVGTGNIIKKKISYLRPDLTIHTHYDIVSNPEFLREGSAIHDFMLPDRIIIGLDDVSKKAKSTLMELYGAIASSGNTTLFFTSIETSELIKYASNSFLAVKISFINEIANLCERTGADVSMVAKGMGLDSRIGDKFLNTGPGYGGSCFPKDTRAIVKTASNLGIDLSIIKTAIKSNDNRKEDMAKRIITEFGDIKGKVISVLGLTFKPETDDIRESPSIVVIKTLLEAGAFINIYDPMFKPEDIKVTEAKKDFNNDSVQFMPSIYEAANQSDGIVLMTEWSEFRFMNKDKIKDLMSKSDRPPLFFDFRNMFTKDEMKMFDYFSIGK